jgi:hypothetical protein
MATIGYRSAVVQLRHRVRIRGTAAWLAWLALHLIALLGGRNRISALVNMSWRYLTWWRGGIIGDRWPARPAQQVIGSAGTDPLAAAPNRGEGRPLTATSRTTAPAGVTSA